jgi:hypothetical protein
MVKVILVPFVEGSPGISKTTALDVVLVSCIALSSGVKPDP